MDSSHHDGGEPGKQQPHGTQHNHKSSGELLASAKVVADAAKSAMGGGKTNEIDKARVAGAAADLLDAAEHYGKLEDSAYSKYLDKAEEYLHKYGGGHSTTPADATGGGGHAAPAQGHESGQKPSSESSGGHEGGGYGDYLKMAQGFLHK